MIKIFVKILSRILFVLVGVYVLFIGGLIFIFHNLDRFHGEIESAASNYLGQEVQISEMESAWFGTYLGFYLGDIVVRDREDKTVEYANIKHIAARLDIKSLFYFWPTFRDISVEQPKAILESFTDGSFRFIGKRYHPSPVQQKVSALFLNWLMSQKRVDIHAGEFLWKHREGKQTLVEQLSASYQLSKGLRSLNVVALNDADALGVTASLSGNFLLDNDWSAKAVLRSGASTNYLEKINAQLLVEDGEGSIEMEVFKAQRLVDIVNIIGRGTQLQHWLSQSKLAGELKNVSLDISGALLSLSDWQFKAKGQQLSWESTKKAPGFNSLDADVQINKKQGKISFFSRASTLDWPSQFKSKLPVNELSGDINLRRQGGNFDVQFDNVLFDTDALLADKVQGSLRQRSQQPLFIELTSQVSTKDLQAIEKYFPALIRSKFRNWWKNAMTTGQEVSGTANYKGSLKKEDFFSGKSVLVADLFVDKPKLDYGFQRSWPVLTADTLNIKWRNDVMDFAVSNAKVGNVSVLASTARLSRLFHRDRVLKINGSMNGQLAELVEFLQDGPLIAPEVKHARAPERIDINTVSGKFSSDIDISLPLSKLRSVTLAGNGQVSGGVFSVGDLLSVSDVEGELSYTHDSVSAQNIRATMFGGETKLNVKTLVPGAPPKVRINGTGNASISSMQRLISPHIASRFSGSSAWSGFIDIDQSGVEVTAESGLFGTAVNLPEPFAKKSKENDLISVTFQANQSKETQLQFRSNDIDIKLQSLNRDNLLNRGIMLLGDFSGSEAVARSGSDFNALPNEGIDVFVAGIDVDIDAWIETIQEMAAIESKPTNGTPFHERLRRVSVEPKSLTVFGKNLGKTNFLKRSANGLEWNMEFSGEYANGVGKFRPFDDIASYELTFDRLHWPSEEELAERGIIAPESQEDADVTKPNTYPNVDLKARNFRIFGRDFNEVSFKASVNDNAWQFTELDLFADGVEIKGAGDWLDNGSRYGRTKIDFTVSSDVGGKALSDFGLGEFLKDGEIKMTSSIHWRGAPSHFKFSRLNGDYELDVRKGSFPKVDADSGRFIGLLNLNALSRRLRLDFNDVFGRGLSFDRMRSNGIFNDGDVVLKDFRVLSPSVFIEALGKVGLEREDYDLQMLISPQLGGNVALLAAMSNPAAGAVVWLVDRIFKNRLNQIVIYNYNVTGPWIEPKVTRVIRGKASVDDDALN